MRKNNKHNYKLIIGFILGVIITLSLGVYAAIKYNASDVSYKNKTVKEALDELYKGKEKNSANVYGIVRNINSSTSLWARVEDSKGLVANAQIGQITEETTIQNDFDNIYPWSDIKSYNYNTDTKEITAWYGESEFTFNPEGNIEVLTYIPEFYYKREQKDGYEYVYITRNNKTGFTKSSAFSIGRYIMSGDATRAHSKSDVKPLGYQTITQFRELARKVDPDYIANDEEHPSEFSQLDYHYFIIQLLYLVEYADYNSQAKLGNGNTNNSGAIESGGCNDLGMKSGTLNNDGKHSMIYRGIEDIYGNVYQFIDGINISGYKIYVNYNHKTYASDTFNGEDWYQLGYTCVSSNGYPKYLGYDANKPLIGISSSSGGLGGSSSTYLTDFYQTNPGNRILVVGGNYVDLLLDGLFYFNTGCASSVSTQGHGARFIKTN